MASSIEIDFLVCFSDGYLIIRTLAIFVFFLLLKTLVIMVAIHRFMEHFTKVFVH